MATASQLTDRKEVIQMPENEHPGYTPNENASKGAPPITRDEAMARASRDAGQAAQEREAAQRAGK